MKQLFLLRHAKSSWEDPELADHDRPLAPRGRRAAKLIAEHLRRQGIAPELVLCSSALRTRETLESIAPVLGEDVSVQIEDELYAASEQVLLERVRAVEDGIESLLLIGHNPGVAAAGAPPGRQRGEGRGSGAQVPDRRARDARVQRPAGASSAAGRAELTDFVTPKQLAGR